MAFAIVSCRAYGLQTGMSSRSKGIQVVEFELTGTATDVDLDFGDFDGTFWTAVATSSPNSAASCLALFEAIGAGALSVLDIQGTQLLDRVQVASLTTTGQKLIAVEGGCPDISFNAADGELTYQLCLTWLCGTDFQPIRADFVE